MQHALTKQLPDLTLKSLFNYNGSLEALIKLKGIEQKLILTEFINGLV